jgi:hypothetical protein
MPIQTHSRPKQQLNFHSYYVAQAWRADAVGALSRRWLVDDGASWCAHLRSGAVTPEEWRAIQRMVDEYQALRRAKRKRTPPNISARTRDRLPPELRGAV